ncbi:MAG: hypothetical protein KDD61_06795 [Bdellovibrionales bacterium]|nr:hypothetical protein [Bdellovibrionales bacterium]
MKVLTHKYKLSPRQSLNAQAADDKREGTLLQVQFDDDRIGYADLFPWVELGDLTLLDQLWSLKTGNYTEAVQQSLNLARIDAEARWSKQKLLSEVNLKNHFLIPDILKMPEETVEWIQKGAFNKVKVKMGRELLKETLLLDQLAQILGDSVRFRLDFNCSLEFDEFESWIPSLTPYLRSQIEYYEDPFPYHPEFWEAISEVFKVTLALDHAADPIAVQARGAGVIVIKPAKQNAEKILHTLAPMNKRFVFSHYMDHPVGRMGAIYTAMEMQKKYGELILECGLNDFGFYDEDDFSRELVADTAQTKILDSGFGIGFDEQLSDLEWKKWI